MDVRFVDLEPARELAHIVFCSMKSSNQFRGNIRGKFVVGHKCICLHFSGLRSAVICRNGLFWMPSGNWFFIQKDVTAFEAQFMPRGIG